MWILLRMKLSFSPQADRELCTSDSWKLSRTLWSFTLVDKAAFDPQQEIGGYTLNPKRTLD